MKNKNQYRLDALVLFVLLIISVGISLWLKANFLLSTLLFFGLPSVWLSFQKPERVKKLLLFSVLLAIPLTIIIDYIATIDQSWFVPETIFPSRLFGVIPYEDFIWGFGLIYLVTMFYEHFLDKHPDKLIWKPMKYWGILAGIALVVFTFLFVTDAEILHIKYAYMILGLTLWIGPSVIFLFFYPHLLKKFFVTLAYFFPAALVFELTGLYLGQWTFPGENFVGWVNLFGHSFPFEELLFWLILGPIGILSYYEYFNDDRR